VKPPARLMTGPAVLADGARSRLEAAAVERHPRGLLAVDRLAFRVELGLLVFIVVTLPWEFTKLWFPTPLLEVSRLGTLAALGILTVHALNGTLRVPRTRLLLAIGAVVGLHVVSFALTRTTNGLRDTAAIAVYACLAIFVAHVVADRRRVLTVVTALGMAALIVALIVVAQEVGNFYLWQAEGNAILGRRNATFGDPNVASRFLAIALVACLALLAAPSTPRHLRIGTLIVAAVVAIADVLTLSRVGWVLAALVVAVWVPLARSRRWLGTGLAVVVVSFSVYLAAAPSTLQRAQAATADAIARTGIGEPGEEVEPPAVTPPDLRQATTPLDPMIQRLPLDSVRKSLIRAGVAMAIDHPLLGVGVGGYQRQILTTYWGFVPEDRRNNPTSLIHTEAVRVLAETGVAGLLVWLGLLVAVAGSVLRAIRSPLPDRRIAAIAAGGVVLVIVIASQFAGRFYSEPFLWLALGMVLVVSDASRWEDAPAAT